MRMGRPFAAMIGLASAAFAAAGVPLAAASHAVDGLGEGLRVRRQKRGKGLNNKRGKGAERRHGAKLRSNRLITSKRVRRKHRKARG